MHRFNPNLALSITLGAAITIGLVVVLGSYAAPVEAQPVLAPIEAPTAPTIDHSNTISKALAYLHTKQLPDGSIEGWTPDTADDFTTIKTVIALAAAQYPVSVLTSVSSTTPLDYLATVAVTYTHDASGTLFPGRAGMLAVAAVAGNEDPYDFGGMNVVHELAATHHAATGAYSTTASQGSTSGAAGTTNQLWAILGLAAAQETVPMSAIGFLIGLQEPDGGWGWGAGLSDVDTTALVVQALIASGNIGPTDAEIQEGLDFLRNAQAASGGWEAWGSLSADSTAAVIQAVVAAGYTPATESWAAASGRTPHDDLVNLQAPDGSFSYNALGTAHAVAGLAEAPLPILGQMQRANRALTWMGELQSVDGSWPTPFGHPAGPTCDAVLAYAAAGFDPYTVKAPGSVTSAMDYLSSTASAFADISADSAGKLALAVEVASGDAHDLGGVDVVRVLTTTWYSPTLEAFGVPTNTWHQAFAMLGLAAAGETVPATATQTLTGLQNADGSWTDAWGFDKPGSTGLALQALIAVGVPTTDTNIVSGVLSLRNEQNAQGSWDAFGSPSVNSTAYAMQGLLAAGEDLEADEWLKDSHSPYNALADLQKIDGPFTLGANDDFFSTRQAVPALLGVPYPFSHTLTLFVGVGRGPDPDRLVTVSPRATWGDSVDVVIPFGSDLDADGSVTLDWHVSGATSWVTDAMVHRADGYYTATLPVTRPVAYEFRVTLTDPDSVQCGGELTGTVTLTATLEPYCASLPLVLKE
jgi:hypothetical protein